MSSSSLATKSAYSPSSEHANRNFNNLSSGLPSLSAQQQSLLLAALESNKRAKSSHNQSSNTASVSQPSNGSIGSHRSSAGSNDTPQSRTYSSSARNGPITFGDSLFSNSNIMFDVDFPAAEDESPNEYLNPALLIGTSGESMDGGEKRKSPDDDEDEDDDEDTGKRREGEEKIAKKPGRKLITTEPTTKRKAQNRAAQRAFRDRKEKHVKDLEQKVTDLEKLSDTASQENSVLRSEIQRLQSELKGYKKRLSSSANGLSTSPTFNGFSSSQPQGTLSGHMSDFQFDFPRFGNTSRDNTVALMSSSNNNSYTDSMIASLSGDFSGQPLTQSPGRQSTRDPQALSFEPGILRGLGTVDYSTNFDPSPDTGNMVEQSVTSRQNSQSTQSHSGSASSMDSPKYSIQNCASSCGTSPEPILNYNLDGPKTFADLTYDQSALYQDPVAGMMPSSGLYDFSNIDWLSQQNGGQFNPQLFGDYRESQAAVVGDGDFTSGFFEDPYTIQDYSGVSAGLNFNLANTSNTNSDATQASISQSSQPNTKHPKNSACAKLMEQVNRCQQGETGHEPGTGLAARNKELMTTHKLWSELQSCPKFLSGDLDIDTLCSELSAKATCAETGMAVPKEVVERVLWKLAGAPEQADSVKMPTNLRTLS